MGRTLHRWFWFFAAAAPFSRPAAEAVGFDVAPGARKCTECGGPLSAEAAAEPCPYASEIHNKVDVCGCCDDCRHHRCAQEI